MTLLSPLLGVLLLGARMSLAPHLTPLTAEEQAVKTALLSLVRREQQAMLRHDERALRLVFLDGSPDGPAARRMLERRDLFLAWARERGVALRLRSLALRTPAIAFLPDGRAQVTAVVSEAYSYRYLGERHEERFGLGVRHYYVLARRGDAWRIAADDFTGPAPEGDGPARPAPGLWPRSRPPASTAGGRRAAAYADRFCGAAPGCGNGGFYNPRYRNFNGDGGDCTNFISQSLAAGGLRENATWAYSARAGDGTRAWSNADGLSDHLAASGRASPIAHGRYSAVAASASGAPKGADRLLRLGDLVSYMQHGEVVHTAVVTAFDAHGVPLVDAHTNDRYHTPWDLGWGSRAVYRLWRVDYR